MTCVLREQNTPCREKRSFSDSLLSIARQTGKWQMKRPVLQAELNFQRTIKNFHNTD